MKKLSQEEIQKAMRECVVSSLILMVISQDLFDVLNEDFTKEYEFIDSP
ncbi:TPA: hypothetical protein R8487_001898, partial [Campylobacter jejuni]|nr:hypothetical protein [Campylobacter jejuni]